jgi:TonB family protein
MKVVEGAVLAFALIGGCAEDKPAQRETSTTSSSASETTSADPGAVTPERQDAVERLFARKAQELQQCWSDEYEKTHNRKLEGDVSVQLMIDPGGRASDVKIVKSTLGNSSVESCVVKSVQSWGFPSGSGSMAYNRTVHLGAQF